LIEYQVRRANKYINRSFSKYIAIEDAKNFNRAYKTDSFWVAGVDPKTKWIEEVYTSATEWKEAHAESNHLQGNSG
jgi:hypothetical protein